MVEYTELGTVLLALVALILWMYRAYYNVHQLPLAWPRHDVAVTWLEPIPDPTRLMLRGSYFLAFAASAADKQKPPALRYSQGGQL